MDTCPHGHFFFTMRFEYGKAAKSSKKPRVGLSGKYGTASRRYMRNYTQPIYSTEKYVGQPISKTSSTKTYEIVPYKNYGPTPAPTFSTVVKTANQMLQNAPKNINNALNYLNETIHEVDDLLTDIHPDWKKVAQAEVKRQLNDWLMSN